ncbi:MAG: hypothetical protein WHT46_03725, partial [Candidatus Geothermincolales bacterium]
VSTVVTSENGVPVVAERAVYDDARTFGHCSVGVTSPSTTWYLAEGATAGIFDCWVLVMNPSPDKTAKGRLTFLTDTGPVAGPTFEIGPGKRHSFHVDSYVTTFDVSTVVTSENGVPVVAERAVYDDARTFGHCSVGYAP